MFKREIGASNWLNLADVGPDSLVDFDDWMDGLPWFTYVMFCLGCTTNPRFACHRSGLTNGSKISTME